jgi:hypothetical protein
VIFLLKFSLISLIRVINLIKHQEGVDFKVVSALEEVFQARV